MTGKNLLKGMGLAVIALSSALNLAAAPKVGMYIGYESTDNENAQESTAAKWFQATYPDGVVITPSKLDKIDATPLDAIWIHIDRVGIGKGFDNLPTEFTNDEVMDALAGFVEDGGNLYLSKFATQLVAPLGRMPETYQPNIFGDGDGGVGTDVWCVNALLGSWQLNPDNQEPDATQVYDRRDHAIYKDMEYFEAWTTYSNYPHPSFPLLGSGDGSELHREDHNCMWDLNGYEGAFQSGSGKNTLENFESQLGCEVIGTWGHVQDYCVAGIVDFAPRGAIQGRILANGLAACEWAPRAGVNGYDSNLKKLTKNALDYLAPEESGVDNVAVNSNATPSFYTVEGIRVDNPSAGIYIKVVDGKASKVLVK